MKYLFVIISATYFLLAGIGYNVAAYCCQDCSKDGVVGMSNCEQIHKENIGGDCCSKQQKSPCHSVKHPSACRFFRVSVDTPSVDSSTFVSKSSSLYVFLLQKFSFLSSLAPEIGYLSRNLSFNDSIPISGRLICTLHSVFLI